MVVVVVVVVVVLAMLAALHQVCVDCSMRLLIVTLRLFNFLNYVNK